MIHFDNVTKTYPNQSRPALENVTLDVEKGEFVFLVGPSGSGKSTFLRLVLKEERPTDGRIHVAGKDLARLTNWKVPHLRRQFISRVAVHAVEELPHELLRGIDLRALRVAGHLRLGLQGLARSGQFGTGAKLGPASGPVACAPGS